MPKPKILFLSGQEIFNELDKKRYFEASSSSVHAQYAFILKVNEEYTENQLEQIKNILNATDLNISPSLIFSPRLGTKSSWSSKCEDIFRNIGLKSIDRIERLKVFAGNENDLKFAKNCDEYFYLLHRNERRGVGGIFFDNFKFNDMDSSLLLLKNMFLIYQDTYNTIFNKRMNRPFSNLQRDFQLYRRGRYVEFNLLHDRGTKFGIQSNGRTESILGSLPPLVTWPNKKPKTIINMEQKLIQQTSKNWSKEIDI